LDSSDEQLEILLSAFQGLLGPPARFDLLLQLRLNRDFPYQLVVV
jgi:hypothetical protein